ncbi:hypothetical protein JCM14469_34880 [Desulfatiferula olefinivorans]
MRWGGHSAREPFVIGIEIVTQNENIFQFQALSCILGTMIHTVRVVSCFISNMIKQTRPFLCRVRAGRLQAIGRHGRADQCGKERHVL